MKINIVIPCFNEKDNLSGLRKDFLKQLDKFTDLNVSLILVDNGSTDGSIDVLSENEFQHPKIIITRLCDNKGYGDGIKHGLKHSDADVYCWAHADLQTPMSDIFKTLYFSISTNNLITAGIRNSSFIQKIQSTIFDNVISIVLKCKIKDTNAQPKIFSNVFKVYFLSDNCPTDFSLDMYYFKVFADISQKVHRYPVRFINREFGEAKGGQASIIGRIILFWRMIRMAKCLRGLNFVNN